MSEFGIIKRNSEIQCFWMENGKETKTSSVFLAEYPIWFNTKNLTYVGSCEFNSNKTSAILCAGNLNNENGAAYIRVFDVDNSIITTNDQKLSA